jgi:HEAT repeat protein
VQPNPIPGFPVPPPPSPAPTPATSPPGVLPEPPSAPTPPPPGGFTPPKTPTGAEPTATPRGATTRGPGVTRRNPEPSITGESWHYWWDYNKDRFLKLKTRLAAARAVQSESTEFFFGRRSGRAATDTDRPGPAYVRKFLLPRLLAALEDEVFEVRYRAAVAVGRVGAQEELPRLVRLLADKHELVREGATMGIALLQHPDARAPLLALLADGQAARRLLGGRKSTDELRGVAAVGLGLLANAHPGIDADGAMRNALIRQSLDPAHDHHIPMACVVALGLFRENKETVRTIAEHLKKVSKRSGAAEWVRAQAVLAIGRLAEANAGATDPDDIAFLEDVLTNAGSAALRRSAALALASAAPDSDNPGSDAVVRALGRKLGKGKDRLTRCFAAIALGHMGGTRAHQLLSSAIVREKQELQVYCALGLGIACGALEAREGSDPELLRSGLQYLRVGFERMRSPDSKGGFAIALGIAGDGAAGPMLLEAYRDIRSTRFRSDCAVALGMVGHDAAAGMLLDAMNGKDSPPQLREHAAVGLGLMGSRQVVQPLVKALVKEKSHYALTAITQAVGLVGDRSAIGPLTDMLDPARNPAHLRTYACWALGSLGDPRPLPALTPIRSNHNYHACCVNFNAMLVLVDR